MSRFGARSRPSTAVSTWLPAGATPFSPLDLSPAAWYDASDTSTITASSNNVSEWRDRSGNGRNLAQPTSAYQPKSGLNTVNGRNVITSSSTVNLFRDTVDNRIGAGKSGCTIYVVRRFTASPTSQVNIYANVFNTGLTLSFVGAGTVSGMPMMAGRTASTDSFQTVNGTVAVSTTLPEIQTACWDYSNTDAFLYINNTLAASTTSWQSTTSTTNIDIYQRVMSTFNGATNGFTGYLCEILVFESLHNEPQRANMLSFLSTRWGITL